MVHISVETSGGTIHSDSRVIEQYEIHPYGYSLQRVNVSYHAGKGFYVC